MTQLEVFTKALERLEHKHGHFTMDVSFGDVAIFIGQMQLALRHPANVGYSAERARQFLETIITTLEGEEPEIGRILRLGFDPQHDV